MQGLLNVTGPIDMRPQYNETVTAQNLVERIHCHQLGKDPKSGCIPEGRDDVKSPDGHSSQRKHFTSYLAEHLMARVRQLTASPSAFSGLSKLITSSLHAKDIQVYLNASPAESLLQRYHFSSAIQPPPGDNC